MTNNFGHSEEKIKEDDGNSTWTSCKIPLNLRAWSELEDASWEASVAWRVMRAPLCRRLRLRRLEGGSPPKKSTSACKGRNEVNESLKRTVPLILTSSWSRSRTTCTRCRLPSLSGWLRTGKICSVSPKSATTSSCPFCSSAAMYDAGHRLIEASLALDDAGGVPK